jgi:3-phenylpropionate/trans-cinnamate dioxygenase ferredoxin subunit
MKKVCKASDVKKNSMKGFTVKDRQILIANVSGKYYAMDSVCSHAKGYLPAGKLEGFNVICPVHGSQFDVRTGEVVKNVNSLIKMATHSVATKMKAYKVTEKEGNIYLNIK